MKKIGFKDFIFLSGVCLLAEFTNNYDLLTLIIITIVLIELVRARND